MTMNFIYKSIIDTILKNIDIGIHVVDSSGKTIIYNQAMADMEGLYINEVMGKSILEIFPSLTLRPVRFSNRTERQAQYK